MSPNYMFGFRNNSYPTQASGNGGGYQGRRPNPYAQQDDRNYEMSDVAGSQTHLTTTTTAVGGDMGSFYSEVQHQHFSLGFRILKDSQ